MMKSNASELDTGDRPLEFVSATTEKLSGADGDAKRR
jgi:hypothetical protein